MTVQIIPMTDEQVAGIAPRDDGGLGCIRTERGNLPLAAVDVKADIAGLVYRVELTQQFVNTHQQPLEATYIFPLPDRAAVTGMRMAADDRVIEAQLQERAAARQAYDQAIAAGQRASIAEEERPDVFTMRVGNIVPGERVTVTLTLAGPLSYSDGAGTFRFPLVVAPRYIPGAPLPDAGVGTGYADDTDPVPDASRITPPVLLPGFPHPVRLSIDVGVDPAGLPLGDVRSSLHAVSQEGGRWRIAPGERANRDFVLRLAYGSTRTESALALHADASGEEGTFELTVLPPADSAPPRPRDVVLVLDRSGSMGGWKMVSARRAAARIVDTLTDADRFAVLTFDHEVDHPDGLPAGLVTATDRNRFRAVQHLSTVDARGGTEMLEPLKAGRALLTDGERDRVLVLLTDGQVGNEDQILRHIGDLSGIRVHAIGIDRAVNAGFLDRLARAGGGRFELVESEDRLDEVMTQIHRRIGAPLVTDVGLEPAGLSIVDGTVAPARLPDLFPGVPLVIRGRYAGAGGRLGVRGRTADGAPWRAEVTGERHDNPAATAIWARAHLRDLEDGYAAGTGHRVAPDRQTLERRIVDTSLRFGVLCRFTAYVAVDTRVVSDGGPTHRVTQPVEPADGWDMLDAALPMSRVVPMAASAGPPLSPPAPAMAPPPAPMGMKPRARPAAAAGFAGRTATQSVGWTAAAPGDAAPGKTARPEHAPVPPPAPPPVPPPHEVPAGGRPPAPDGDRPFYREQGPQPPLAERAREQLDLLTAVADAPDDERWAALVRLAMWLDRTSYQLWRSGVDRSMHDPMVQLKVDITARVAPLAQLWAKAVELLERLAGGPATPTTQPAAPTTRRAFWKRGD